MPAKEAEDSDGSAKGGGQLKTWIAALGKRGGKVEDPEVLKVWRAPAWLLSVGAYLSCDASEALGGHGECARSG